MTATSLLTAPFYAPQITAAAGRLEHRAAELRQRALLLTTATGRCAWDGAGARAFRHRAQHVLTGLHRSADDVETAATALRRHAATVEDAVARMQAAQAQTTAAVTDRVLELGDRMGMGR